MSEMLERVAEAIWRERYTKDLFSWKENTSEPEKRFYRKEARAAIAAMREPTKEMTENPFLWHLETWHAMIDAALKE